jgi:2-polyprenyl-6-methoxyphenol hydroxylase-like FAD-dependent oxidoreductase
VPPEPTEPLIRVAPSPGTADAAGRSHILIIGAGIGGLTAALSLQRQGFLVSVYERAPDLHEFGAGLIVTPNAMHALDFLGVGKATWPV